MGRSRSSSHRHSSSRNHRRYRDEDDDERNRRRNRDDDDGSDKEKRSRSHHRRQNKDHNGDDSRRYSDDESDDHHESRRRHDRDRSRKKEKRKESSHSRGGSSSRRDEREYRERKKKKKREKESSRRHRERDDSEEDERRERKRHKQSGCAAGGKQSHPPRTSKPDKATLFDMGSQTLGHPPEESQRIDPTKDYFTCHQPFWVYLYREEGTYFNDLTSDDSKQAFTRFADRYNRGDLELPYYDGLPPEVIQECKTTRHAWSFQTTDVERRGLQNVQQGVRKQTEYNNSNAAANFTTVTTTNPTCSLVGQPKNNRKDEEDSHERRAVARAKERVANKRLRDHVKNVHEELAGGPKDFRERQIEKRKEQGSRQHGANRDRASEAAGMELFDAAIYGGGDASSSSFRAALSRERQRKEKRDERKTKRVQELQQKEQDRQQNMLKASWLI